MKRDEFHEAILNRFDTLDRKLDDVRTKDIPGLQTAVAGFHEKIEMLKNQQKWSTRIYTVLGGAIAVAITKFTGHP